MVIKSISNDVTKWLEMKQSNGVLTQPSRLMREYFGLKLQRDPQNSKNQHDYIYFIPH